MASTTRDRAVCACGAVRAEAPPLGVLAAVSGRRCRPSSKCKGRTRRSAGPPPAIAALRALQVRDQDVAEAVQEIGMWSVFPRDRLGDEVTHRIVWIPGVLEDIGQGDDPSITSQRRTM